LRCVHGHGKLVVGVEFAARSRVTSFNVVEGPPGTWAALIDIDVAGLTPGNVLVVTVEHGVSMASEGGERQQRQDREV
jgi:hypothetical protein